MAGTQHNRDIRMTYYSESKKVHIPICDEAKFNDFHLVATCKKLLKSIQESADFVSGLKQDLEMLLALGRELGYRDLDPFAGKGGRPPDDPRNAPEPPPDDEFAAGVEEGYNLGEPQGERATFTDEED